MVLLSMPPSELMVVDFSFDSVEHPAPVEHGPDVDDDDAEKVVVDVVKGLVVSSKSKRPSSVVDSWSLMSSPGCTHLLVSPSILGWAGQVQMYSCLP